MYDLDALAHALTLLGVAEVEIRDNEVYAKCPGHLKNVGRQDRNPSWHMNEEGVHNCWSCKFSGHLTQLVIDQLGLVTNWGLPNYAAAEEWIRDHVGDVLTGAAARLDVHEPYVALPKPVPMTEARLAVFDEPPDWALEARSISREAAKHYGILWEPRNGWWITPIRHPITHALMGWQEKGEDSRYFKNRPYTVKKSSTLFGLKQWQRGRMIVVESPLDVARIATVLGLGVAVASYGAKVSDSQVAIMRESEDLIWAFDNDEAGHEASEKMLKARLIGKFFNYGMTGAKDPGEMLDEEIVHAVKTARSNVRGVKAYSGM